VVAKIKVSDILRKDTERRLQEARVRVEAGDGLAVLAALKECFFSDVPIPRWLADAFVARVDIVLRDHKTSWDDAFGKPWPRVHASKFKQWQRDRIRVHLAMLEVMKETPKPAKDDILFARLGRTLGLAPTLVKDHYNERDGPYTKAAKFRENRKTSGKK
jgi:hypothetical protein